MKRIILLVPLALLLFYSSVVNAQSLKRGEYFYDTDPGAGNGTPVTIATPSDSVNLNLTIPGPLTAGWHYLYFRFQDSLGHWGLYNQNGQSLYVTNNFIDTGANSSPKISAAEYYIDSDPGVGHGSAFTAFTAADSVSLAQDVATGSLHAGFHYLYARFKYSNGVWGNPSLSESFYVTSNNIDTNAHDSPMIAAAEYYIDSDPGVGHGTALPAFTAADSVNISDSVATGSLATGFHYLYSRFQYSNGVWGIPSVSASFYVINPATQISSPPINYVEYFVDSDPGVANGSGTAITPSTDSANVNLTASTIGLKKGIHVLFARFRYTNGVWGLYQPQGDTMTICIPPADSIIALGPTTYCKGSSVTLSSDTSNIWTYQWQLNGANLTGDTSTTLVVTDSSGIYNVLVTDTAGCTGISDSITVTVPAASLSWASLVGAEQLNVSGSDTAICEGHTVTLSGGSPSGGTYSGDSVTGNTLFAYTGSGSDVITYTVTVDGCVVSASDVLNFTICTGINQVNPDYGVSLYPNPALDVLVLQSSYFETTEVKPVLYDITGQLITTAGFTRQTDKFTYNTSSLPGGVYFIKLNMAGNEVTKMFVKVE